jgi:thiol-disulfide isomerase/thioredoxin
MRNVLLPLAILSASVASAGIVQDVRQALAKNDFALAETRVHEYQAANGITPEGLEAFSWLGRGALAAKELDKAEKYAHEAQKLCLDELKKRPLDQEDHLPIALGATIEVQAQVMAARGERGEAVEYLRKELATYRTTSMLMRIQKNINLLTLEDKPVPPLQVSNYLPGVKPTAVAALKGKPVLLFFWAHWCGDCKFDGPIIARLKEEFAPSGLAVIAPTQHYGYVAGGVEATPDVETKYMDEVRHKFYPGLLDVPAPVSEENFKNYGASTVPTIVLVDRRGIVRLYHPGRMTYEELRPLVEQASRPAMPAPSGHSLNK